MALETGTFISDLVATNPVGSDPLAFADDHLRLVKSTIKNTFPNITGAVTKTHTQINALPSFDQIYPVGSIYINATNGTNPGTLLGFGTWVAFGAGRVPVGFDGGDALFNAAEKTGGSKDATLVSHSHTVSASGTTGGAGSHSHSVNDPGHAHTLSGRSHAGATGTANEFGDTAAAEDFTNGTSVKPSGTGISINGVGDHTHSVSVSGSTSTNGSSETNANLQPYITVYMWKRTA